MPGVELLCSCGNNNQLDKLFMSKKELYLQPTAEVFELRLEGLVCMSGGDGNEIMGTGSSLGNDDFV